MISVIIPAFNEEKTIANLLYEYKGLENLYEVIVVTNGCTDKTFQEASNFSFVKLKNLTIGSKINAINEGFDLINGNNVMVQDGDVIIDKGSLINLSNLLSSNKYPFVTLTPKFEGGSYLVKKFYSFMSITPVFKQGMVSSGVYIINKNHFEKIFPLPNVISDDGYVKSIMGEDKLFRVKDSYSKVLIPRNLYSLVKIKTRSRIGNLQLNNMYNISPTKKGNKQKEIFYIAIEERMYFGFFLYSLIIVVCRLRSIFQLNFGKGVFWERDNSNR